MWITYSVRILECPTVKAVVRRVEATFREPSDITIFESTTTDSSKWSIPMEHLKSRLHRQTIAVSRTKIGEIGDRRQTDLSPKLIRISTNSSTMQVLVITDPWPYMWLRMAAAWSHPRGNRDRIDFFMRIIRHLFLLVFYRISYLEC